MGLLKGRMEDYSSPLAALPVRLFCGYFFLKYGLEKATGGFGGAALRRTLDEWAAGTPYAFYRPFLLHVAMPYSSVFASLVTVGEIVVGVTLLLGIATRLGSLLGLFLCLNFMSAMGTPLLSVEHPIFFAIMLLTVYASAAGRALGFDQILKGRLPRWAA